jgi:hypothetical protein
MSAARPTRAVRLSLTALATVLLLSPVASRQLTAIRVPDRGDLQAALNAARPFDERFSTELRSRTEELSRSAKGGGEKSSR